MKKKHPSLTTCRLYVRKKGIPFDYRESCNTCKYNCPGEIRKRLIRDLHNRQEKFRKKHFLKYAKEASMYFWTDAGINSHFNRICTVTSKVLNPSMKNIKVVIKDINNEAVKSTGDSNVAEMMSIIEALKMAPKRTKIYAGNDSSSVIHCLKCFRRVQNPEMRRLLRIAYRIIEGKNLKVLFRRVKNKAGKVLEYMNQQERNLGGPAVESGTK